jgi:hypothetical protein
MDTVDIQFLIDDIYAFTIERLTVCILLIKSKNNVLLYDSLLSVRKLTKMQTFY